MASGPLIVAGVAAALLVVVLGVDASMSTTYVLDVWTGSGWKELARDPYNYDGRSMAPYSLTTISANASEDVKFRLRLENTYAWGVTDDFRAVLNHNGEEVASGQITAPGRSNAVREFGVPAARYFAAGGSTPEPKGDGRTASFVSGDLQVEVDGRYLYANFQLQEVSR